MVLFIAHGSFFSSSSGYRLEDIFDAKRVMSAFLWSMPPAHVISLARKNCFGILPKEETRFYHNRQQLSVALSQGKSAEDIMMSSSDTMRTQLVFDFYDYNPALLYFCLNQNDPVYRLHPNLIKLCIDAWIKKVGCKKRINKKYSPYAIRSINTILSSDDDFSHSRAEGKDIILKVLVFLSLEHEAFKTPGDHHDILHYLKTFVTDYFLEPRNISNLGSSASTAGGGSSSAAPPQLFHKADAAPDLHIWSRVLITGLRKSVKHNAKQALILGIVEHERYKVFTDDGCLLAILSKHLNPHSGEHVIYDELLRYLLRLEHTIVKDRPGLQILSRDNIASLVNNSGAYLAYFYFMQRLYHIENEIYGNLQVYNRLRLMPDSCAKQFYNCYTEQCWLQGSDIRANASCKAW